MCLKFLARLRSNSNPPACAALNPAQLVRIVLGPRAASETAAIPYINISGKAP